MHRNDITPKILNNLYWKKCLSEKEISSFLKCNITTIHKRMVKFNIKRRAHEDALKIAMRKNLIKIPKSRLHKLYIKNKKTIFNIANLLGYDRSIIKRELKRYAIPLRSLSETKRIEATRHRIKKSAIVELYYKQRLTQAQIGQRLNRHGNTILALMKKYGLKTRPKSETSKRYPKYKFSGDKKEKAYLIGFRKGDLNITMPPSKNFLVVSCTSTKKNQIELFSNIFKKYGHIWISKKRKDGNRVFVVRLNHSFDFLISKKDIIPNWILKNKASFLSFFAGYADAEGCFYIAKNNVSVFQIASYDKNILKGIYNKLNIIGVECRPPKIHIKKGYIKSDGYSYKNDEWVLRLNKKSPLLKLCLILETRLKHQKRLMDLKKVKKNIIKRNRKFILKTCQ